MTKPLYLTEKNAGMSFRVSALSESLKKEIDESGMLIVRNVPCTILNETNANGRLYETGDVQNSLNSLEGSQMFESRQLLCTADDHPESTFPEPSNSSHVVLGAKIERIEGKDVLLNDWLILDTTQGKNLRALIEAGVSVGTSIRGLGRQDESTGAITQYEFLGTDAVGNPSAGTFAKFTNITESCSAGIVIESLSTEESAAIKESLNLSPVDKVGGKEETMFDLQEAINKFNEAHTVTTVIESATDKDGNTIALEGEKPVISKLVITPEALSDLLQIERRVIEEGTSEDKESFESFKSSVVGKAPSVSKKENTQTAKTENAKDEDTVNKTERHLESQGVVMEHLREQSEELQNQLATANKKIEGYNKLIPELTNRVKEALISAKEREQTIEESEQEIIRICTEAGKEAIADLQEEAKETILTLEIRLEHMAQITDVVCNHFKASQIVIESLKARIASGKKVEETEITTVSSRVAEKIQESKKEPKPYRQWK